MLEGIKNLEKFDPLFHIEIHIIWADTLPPRGGDFAQFPV